jgi:hypothetical protein
LLPHSTQAATPLLLVEEEFEWTFDASSGREQLLKTSSQRLYCKPFQLLGGGGFHGVRLGAHLHHLEEEDDDDESTVALELLPAAGRARLPHGWWIVTCVRNRRSSSHSASSIIESSLKQLTESLTIYIPRCALNDGFTLRCKVTVDDDVCM